jgi:amidase
VVDAVGRSWVGATALQIARAVQRGDVNATGVVADHIDHAVVADRVIDAVRVLRDSAAIVEAEMVDEQPDLANLVLAGVPALVQENTPVAGLPTWNGSAAARTAVAEADHEVVRRLRGAGAVVLGVGRMSELGLWATTDDASGSSRNPWRTDRSSGGSAGGCAAAVAAGIVPIAQGVDVLGSVRIGAAACGVVGFKPGRGILPYDLGATDWFGLAEHGLYATNVADLAAAFGVLAGRAAATPSDVAHLSGRVRAGVSLRSPVPGALHDAGVRAAVLDAARLLVRRGHDAVTADPPYPLGLVAAEMATWLASAYAESAMTDHDHLQPRTRRHVALGGAVVRRRTASEDGVAWRERCLSWRERCLAWFANAGVDLLVMPAVPTSPPSAARWSSRSWRANVAASLRYGAYTTPWNLAGVPAIVVPRGVRRDGLPAAVQLVGPPGAEPLLFAVAGQLERDAPWRPHAPTWPRTANASRRVNGQGALSAAGTGEPLSAFRIAVHSRQPARPAIG